VTSPFEQIAPQYAVLWSDTERGRAQRQRVWRELDRLFHPGDQVLDLGCGTGDDALYLASRGVNVLGIDSADGMIKIARERGVEAWPIAIEEMSWLHREFAGAFDGALSNFGALNCIQDLTSVSADLAQLVRPGGRLALCVMSRFCWSDHRNLIARWLGHATWRGIDVHYRSARSIARTFAPYFVLQKKISIGRGDHQLLIFTRRAK
jgi:ubiquinone/menaquinone biosynthesis C-methylase UbiE